MASIDGRRDHLFDTAKLMIAQRDSVNVNIFARRASTPKGDWPMAREAAALDHIRPSRAPRSWLELSSCRLLCGLRSGTRSHHCFRLCFDRLTFLPRLYTTGIHLSGRIERVTRVIARCSIRLW